MNETKAKNYVKKKSGTGGGHVIIDEEKLKKKMTHNYKKNGIKDIVMNMGNKRQDKFENVEFYGFVPSY